MSLWASSVGGEGGIKKAQSSTSPDHPPSPLSLDADSTRAVQHAADILNVLLGDLLQVVPLMRSSARHQPSRVDPVSTKLNLTETQRKIVQLAADIMGVSLSDLMKVASILRPAVSESNESHQTAEPQCADASNEFVEHHETRRIPTGTLIGMCSLVEGTLRPPPTLRVPYGEKAKNLIGLMTEHEELKRIWMSSNVLRTKLMT